MQTVVSGQGHSLIIPRSQIIKMESPNAIRIRGPFRIGIRQKKLDLCPVVSIAQIGLL